MTDGILWTLALFGVFNLGILATFTGMHISKSLPWQHTVQLHADEAARARALAEEKDKELKQIRETLLGSLPKNR